MVEAKKGIELCWLDRLVPENVHMSRAIYPDRVLRFAFLRADAW